MLTQQFRRVLPVGYINTCKNWIFAAAYQVSPSRLQPNTFIGCCWTSRVRTVLASTGKNCQYKLLNPTVTVKRNGSLCTQSGSTLCMSSSFLLNMGNISHLIHSDMAEIRHTWALHGRVSTDSESKILNWKSLEETYSALHNGTWLDCRLGR